MSIWVIFLLMSAIQRILPSKTIFHTAFMVDLRVNPSPKLEAVNVHGTESLIYFLNNVLRHPQQQSCLAYISWFLLNAHLRSNRVLPYVDQ
jgi:hypothetical protein